MNSIHKLQYADWITTNSWAFVRTLRLQQENLFHSITPYTMTIFAVQDDYRRVVFLTLLKCTY
jgi:hypothetical protein